MIDDNDDISCDLCLQETHSEDQNTGIGRGIYFCDIYTYRKLENRAGMDTRVF